MLQKGMATSLPIRLRTIAAAVVVIASGLTIFYSYQSIINSTDGDNLQALPIIRAEKEPFRVAPEEPGGAEIPNKGRKLFEVLDADHPDDLALDGMKIEQDAVEEEPSDLFENTDKSGEEITGFEIPVVPEKRTESLYGMIDELKDEPEVREVIVEEAATEKTPEISVAEIIVETEVNETVVEEVKVEKPEVEEVVANVIKPLRKPKPPVKARTVKKEDKPKTFSLDRILKEAPVKKRHYIQLASVKSADDAKSFYNRIREQFPNLVAGLNVFFPQADLGTRGTFTRVQIGPLDQGEAKSRCADYSASARGGTCLVISR